MRSSKREPGSAGDPARHPAPKTWRIRPLEAADLPQVMTIELRAYPFPWTEGIFRDCLKAGYSAWALADDQGHLGGYAMMSMAVDEAHVLNLCVDPSLQRHGHGRHMLHHLIRLARAANATIVLLEVRKSNTAAIRLYDAEGFKRLGMRKNYYPAAGGREDALVLGFDIV
jgi:ribosomal-protein-alanine N-acetyltransferase